MPNRYGEVDDVNDDGVLDDWLAANPDRAHGIEVESRALLGLPPIGNPIGRVATLALEERVRKIARREAAQHHAHDGDSGHGGDGASWS